MPDRVFVLGSFVVDLMCRTPRLPKPGETVFAGPFAMGPGGKGSNQAIAAQRAGALTLLCTRIGRDRFGDLAVETFEKVGLAGRSIIRDGRHATGAALIMVDDVSAENIITVSIGACNHFTLQEVERFLGRMDDTDILLVQLETNIEATAHAIRLAGKRGIRVILNPAPVREIPGDLYQYVTYLTPNETEASRLTGIEVTCAASADRAAQKLIDFGCEHVIVTLGAKGALCAFDGYAGITPAYDIGTPVDTTGAGDAFNGGLATALAEGHGINAAVQFGCATAALSVTRVGTAPAMPLRMEIESLMAGRWTPPTKGV